MVVCRIVMLTFCGYFRDEKGNFVEQKLWVWALLFITNISVFIKSTIFVQNKNHTDSYAIIVVDNFLFYIQMCFYLFKYYHNMRGVDESDSSLN